MKRISVKLTDTLIGVFITVLGFGIISIGVSVLTISSPITWVSCLVCTFIGWILIQWGFGILAEIYP